MTKWLVTGGAGFVGSSIVHELMNGGQNVIVLDNFSTGHMRHLNGIPEEFVLKADIFELARLHTRHLQDVTGVIHCAGLKRPGESTLKPLHYYHTNVEGTRVLLDWCESQGVKDFIFSSSCSVYGKTESPATESDPIQPQSPYARSKAIAEQMIMDYQKSTSQEFAAVSLRYFNVVGLGGSGSTDNSLSNLVPALCFALRNDLPFTINGIDYATKDGSCVRDYVDVNDIAKAHVAVAVALAQQELLPPAINLGTSNGYSVLEIIREFERVTQRQLTKVRGPRRPGDPDSVLADASQAQRLLDWEPIVALGQSLESAWLASENLDQGDWIK